MKSIDRKRQDFAVTLLEGSVLAGVAIRLLLAASAAPHHAGPARPCPSGVNAGTCLGRATSHAFMPYLWHALAGGVVGALVGLVLIVVWRSLSAGGAESTRPRRQAIPERVRHDVWRRDGGTCIDRGSRERLEFDHIITSSRGGLNTARNLELRCEACNRGKAARI